MNRQFLFIKSATESIAMPVDSFSHAEYTSDTSVSVYFDAKRSGKEATIKVVLAVSSGKANDVVSAITSQVASGNAPVIKVDDVNNVFHVKNITGVTSITTTDSPSVTTGPTGATGPQGPQGDTGANGADGSDATGLGGTDQTLSGNRVVEMGSNSLDFQSSSVSKFKILNTGTVTSIGRLTVGGNGTTGGTLRVGDSSGQSNIIGLQHPDSGSGYTLKLPVADGSANQVLKTDGSGNLSFGAVTSSTLTQVYSQSFFDDIGTSKHFLPFKDINEQTQVYQEEAAMLMPFDGRIRSVSIKGSQVGNGGNFTVGIETLPVGDSIFSSANWTEVESEQLEFGTADSNHVFHFVFDNAKHFDAGESCSISLQADADPGSNAYWHVTTVVDFDTSGSLGTSSTEHETTP